MELLQLNPLTSPAGPLTLQSQYAIAPNLIAPGTLALPLLPPSSVQFARSATDASGRWTLYMLIPYSPAEEGSFMLRLTDPLARQSTASF